MIVDSGDHVDSDVHVPNVVVEENEDIEEELLGPLMSCGKAELVELVEEQLRLSYTHRGLDAEDTDLEELAICLCEMSACDVPELFNEGKFEKEKMHEIGLRP